MTSNAENYLNSVNLHNNTDFPYLVLEVINDRSYPRNPGFQVMHWHQDLQFIYVISGTIAIKTLEHVLQVSTGEGIFINKNVVHYVKRLGHCHYNSFIFPAYFLTFYLGSLAKKFVDCITEKGPCAIYHFCPEIPWCDHVLSLLRQLTALEKNKTAYYIYEVLVLLTSLWLIICKYIPQLPVPQENVLYLRMQKFLQYIEQHYGEDVTLEALAKSATVSKSECLRCFKQSMQTTPYQYVKEYRLAKAAVLLRETQEPIGTVASHVGFHQVSHFGTCFKEKTGLSPSAYKKHAQKETV